MGINVEEAKEGVLEVARYFDSLDSSELEAIDNRHFYDLLEKNSSIDKFLTEHYLGDTCKVLHEALDDVGVACFSDSSKNMPMWWNYATERKGVCLEFSMKDFSPKYPFIHLLPVRYVETLPDITSRLLLDKTGMFSLQYAVVHLCMHKHISWSFEREWRVINFTEMSNKVGGNTNTFKFIPPSKIILGDKINNLHKDEIVDIARKMGIIVTQMEIKATGYNEKPVHRP